MSAYAILEERLGAVAAAARVLRAAESVILTTHVNADGDGAGCQAALLSVLEAGEAEAWVVNPTPFPDHLRFMVADETRILEAGGDRARTRCQAADLCIVVDTAETKRIGRVGPLVSHLPTLVIDHHPPSEERLGTTALCDVTAAAAGELVFDLIWSLGGPWTGAVVDGLYVAIMTDTGSFRFSNVTSQVHRITAELIERGASPDELYRRVYGRVSLRRVKLLQEVLPTLAVSPGGSVASISVPLQLFRDLGCTNDDLEGLVDYPRELEDIQVGLLFRELDGHQVKVSMRSNGLVDVNRIARSFGGGGHSRASGALISGSLEGVRESVVAEVEAEAAKLSLPGAR